jgi:Flp pilus assembly protein CpaB
MARTLTSGRLVQPTRRVDLRVFAGFFVLLATLGGGLLFWQTLDQTEPILVYAHDLPAGAVIQPTDLTTVSLVVPAALSGGVVRGADRDQVIGKVTAEQLHARGLVQTAQLTGRPAVPPGGGIVALPVSASSAAGGRIQVGDHVRVIATWNRGRVDARTQTILADAIVEDVGRAPQAGLGASADAALSSVSVVVDDPALMEQLVAAKENAALDLIWLAPPASVPQPSPPPTPTAPLTPVVRSAATP